MKAPRLLGNTKPPSFEEYESALFPSGYENMSFLYENFFFLGIIQRLFILGTLKDASFYVNIKKRLFLWEH